MFALLAHSVCAGAQDAGVPRAPQLGGGGEPGLDKPDAAHAVATGMDPQRRAKLIGDFLAGRLDPEVDASSLLRFSLADAQQGADVLNRARALGKGAADAKTPPLVAALAKYLRLSVGRQRALLRKHEQRRRMHAQLETQLASARARLTDLEARRTGLQLLLDDALPGEQGLSPVLAVDLSPRPATASSAPELRALEQKIGAVRQAHAQLLERYLALDDAERARLIEAHAQRTQALETKAQALIEAEAAEATRLEQAKRAQTDAQARAKDAATRRTEALAAVQAARSEAQRLLATERAAMLETQEAIANAEATLASAKGAREAIVDRAIGLQRRVHEIQRLSFLDAGREVQADRLYAELQAVLAETRRKLPKALAAITEPRMTVERPGPGPDTSGLPEEDRQSLRTMRRELLASYTALEDNERTARQELARTLRASMVRLNETRLSLLPYTSSATRDAELGFGAAGAAQVNRELAQLALELRYQSQMADAQLSELRARARADSAPLFFSTLMLLLLIGVFRWWRANADGWLDSLHRSQRSAHPSTFIQRTLADLAWYARRVRKPIEWLIFAHLVIDLLDTAPPLGGLSFARMTITWVTLGWALTLLIDAIAAHQRVLRRTVNEAPKLRLSSLRLVGLMIVFGGLLVGWTVQGVGQGTIHRWVQVTLGVLWIPVIFVLLRWWHEPIFSRLEESRDASPFADWLCKRSTGFRGHGAAALGAVYLFATGSFRWVLREAGRFEWMQRAMAYIFRTQVARQAQAQEASHSMTPLPPDEARELWPRTRVAGWVVEVAEEELQALREQTSVGGSATIVVGERGVGRTSLLMRLTEACNDGHVLTVQCPVGGVGAFEKVLQQAMDARCEGADRGNSQALADAGVRVVCVDDVQRVVRPAVGGLDPFERLVDIAQRQDPRIAWVFTVTASAWAVISRARDSSSGFDRVISLGAWNDRQIGALMTMRTAAAGLTPSFENLAVPRQFDALEEEDADRRNEVAYHRILWDYSSGNPTVALLFWRRSLVRDEDGALIVRLFAAPPPAEIEGLPMALQFILRAVIQLDRADVAAVSDCTALPAEDVHDGLQLALRRGYVEQVDGSIIIRLEWFRAITTVLRRQHLLLS